MTVKELYDELKKVVDDGNGGVEITTVLHDGTIAPIEYVEIYDDPVYMVLA